MTIEDDQIKPLENKFFKRLYNLALNHMNTSDKMVAYHACFVVKGGNILGVGLNNKKQNSLVRLHYEFFCGQHSELNAILDARCDLKGKDVYVIRVRRDQSIANSAPCDMCLSLLSGVGVKRAFFTTDDGKINVMKIKARELSKKELYIYNSFGLVG